MLRGTPTETEPEREPQRRECSHFGLTRFLLGDPRTIAGGVYGTIVVLAVLTAGAAAYRHDLWSLAAVTATSVVVLWAAHVYAHGLGESVGVGRRLTTREVAAIARRESAVPLVAVPIIGVVVLGAAGVLGDDAALWIAFGLGVLTLGAQGLRYARLEELTRAGTVATVALNVALGLSLVALKVALVH